MSAQQVFRCLETAAEKATAVSHPPIVALSRVPVSQFFRETALNTFPVLRERSDYWTLFCYLLFGSWNDEDTHRLLLSAEILSVIEGRDPANSAAEKFLINFKNEVLSPTDTIEWTRWYEPKK